MKYACPKSHLLVQNAMNKTQMVKGIFNSIYKKYDLMNDLMSFTSHRFWKDKIISMIDINCTLSEKIIDVACGTCDISMRITKKFPHTEVFSCDINESMLSQGRDRLINNGILDCNFICCNAEGLPFLDNIFACYIIVFGIRNVQNREKALSEAFRILKGGGQFICMEFSPITDDSLFQKFYDFYSFKIIPKIGLITTGSEDPYTYLVNSIRNFPSGDTFAKEIQGAGFSDVNQVAIANGVVRIHTGYKKS